MLHSHTIHEEYMHDGLEFRWPDAGEGPLPAEVICQQPHRAMATGDQVMKSHKTWTWRWYSHGNHGCSRFMGTIYITIHV